jgi:hypothetical protein
MSCPHVPIEELYWRQIDKGELPETDEDGFSEHIVAYDRNEVIDLVYLIEYDDFSVWQSVRDAQWQQELWYFTHWIYAKYILPCENCKNPKIVDSVRGRFCI